MKYINIKKLLIKFMGGGLINFPTRFLRWIKIDGDAEGDDGGNDGDGGGDDSECLAFLNNAKSLIENTYDFSWDNVYSISDYDEQYDDEHVINIGNKDTAEYVIPYDVSDSNYGSIFVTGDELDVIKCLVNIERCRHHWIDLGLPSGKLWADSNVGADEPSYYGEYFTNHILYPIDEFSVNILNYIKITDGLPTPAEFYSIPSKIDFEELVENTIQEVYELEGTPGIKFTSKVNSEFIFIPFTGEYNAGDPTAPIPDNPTSAYILTNSKSGQYIYGFQISDGSGNANITNFQVHYNEDAGQIRSCIPGPNTNS